MLAGDGGACLDRQYRSDLVVGMHHAGKNRVRGDRAPQIVGVDAAGSVDRQHDDSCAQAGEKFAWHDDGRVLHPGGDDVRGFDLARTGEEQAFQCEVVGFAAPAREHDFRRLASKQFRDLGSRALDMHPGWRAGPMKAGRVPECVLHDLAHLRRDARRERGAGVVVEIDPRFGGGCHGGPPVKLHILPVLCENKRFQLRKTI